MVDEVDLRLIRCLQDNPRAPYSSISRLTGVSETTVRRRIDALIDSRIITTAVFPNPRRLGYDVQATVGLKVEPGEVDRVALELRDIPEIAFVSVTLGRLDINTYVVTNSMHALTELVTHRIAEIEGVRDTETSVSARVFKAFANWRVPLEQLEDEEDEPWSDDEQFTAF
jgi:Lrp/AsnC family transcriptional regulator, regulator for asnA, asnC and gidA